MMVLQVSTHLNIGGIGNYIASLSRALKDKGMSVAVASSGGDLEDSLRRCGISHRYLDIRTKSELSPKILKSVFGLCRIIRDEKADIMHAHTRVSQVVCFFASRITGLPYITTCHGYFKLRMRRIFDTWGKKVIAISDAVSVHLKGDLGVDENRIDLIYSGVDMNRFARRYSADEIATMRKAMGLADGPVIGTIGRLSGVKGQRFLIQAMKDVVSSEPLAQGLIVGNGEEEEALKDLARSLGLEDSIHFLDADPDTHKYLSLMDIFVFPSIKEGLGLSLLEALAQGVPCVASRVGGIGDVVKDRHTGMLVEPGDSTAISDAVLYLLKHTDARGQMGRNGIALIKERFLIESMADKVIGLYKKVLEAR